MAWHGIVSLRKAGRQAYRITLDPVLFNSITNIITSHRVAAGSVAARAVRIWTDSGSGRGALVKFDWIRDRSGNYRDGLWHFQIMQLWKCEFPSVSIFGVLSYRRAQKFASNSMTRLLAWHDRAWLGISQCCANLWTAASRLFFSPAAMERSFTLRWMDVELD